MYRMSKQVIFSLSEQNLIPSLSRSSHKRQIKHLLLDLLLNQMKVYLFFREGSGALHSDAILLPEFPYILPSGNEVDPHWSIYANPLARLCSRKYHQDSFHYATKNAPAKFEVATTCRIALSISIIGHQARINRCEQFQNIKAAMNNQIGLKSHFSSQKHFNNGPHHFNRAMSVLICNHQI